MSKMTNRRLPVDVVFHPSWWHKQAEIVFDEDFFYHPLKRVESERRMEQVLYDLFGEFGLGEDRNRMLPQIGAVHLAAGYLLSEMLGCRIEYHADSSPQVICAGRDELTVDVEGAFQSAAFQRLLGLIDSLRTTYGYVCGDINWGGVLNLALDLKGESVLLDMMMQPDEVKHYFNQIAEVVERFFSFIYKQTNSSSISVTRTVRLLDPPIFLHSECAHTMIAEADYKEFLMPIDKRWNEHYQPFGIHYCGADPHRFAPLYGELEYLSFFDLGWGGDVAEVRRHLPDCFLNIRLDPTGLNQTSHEDLESLIRSRVVSSGNPNLTGVSCINMDASTDIEKVRTIFRTVDRLRMQ